MSCCEYSCRVCQFEWTGNGCAKCPNCSSLDFASFFDEIENEPTPDYGETDEQD